MGDKRVIHLGFFIRHEREIVRGWSRPEMIRKMPADIDGKRLSEKRLYEIEMQPEPKPRQRRSISKIAGAFGWPYEEFDSRWQKTMVPIPEDVERKSPSAPASPAADNAQMLDRFPPDTSYLANLDKAGLAREAIRVLDLLVPQLSEKKSLVLRGAVRELRKISGNSQQKGSG